MPPKSETHARIIEAARDLFYHKGYFATSFSDIAASADVPRGNFYYYFKTKDQLLESVIDARLDELRLLLADLERGNPDPRERVQAYLELPWRFENEVSRFGCPVGSLVMELSKCVLSMREKAREMFAMLTDWLIHQLRQLMDDDAAREVASRIVSRQQGASLMASAYEDTSWTRKEVEALKAWLEERLQA